MCTLSALPAGATGAEQSGAAARPAVAAGAADHHRGPAVSARTTIAEQHPAGSADAAGGTRAAGPTGPTVADKPGGAAIAAGLPGGPGRAGPAVTPQDSAGTTVTARRRGVGAVTDQRPAEQRLRGRIDRVERQVL
ncbi:hypothetical protein BB170200_02078 [Mycobacterium marinum]|nr:hypothetical protein BB170200_02078 [Mycobacterium marinum]